MKRLVWLSLIFSLVLQSACAATGGANSGLKADGKQPALGEEFKILPHEKVSIRETGLAIQLDKVVRSWYVNGQGERVSVEFTTSLDGKEEKQYLDFAKNAVTVGEFEIKLLAADPFGKNECKFKVTRRER